MATNIRQWIVWAPRVLGLLMAGFLALFALDVFTEGSGFAAVGAFAIHLVPALVILAVGLVSWRYPALGAATFIGLAMLYAWIARAHLDWILVISGPLMLLGLLFLWNWRQEHTRA
jgi:hypothetical protein